MSVPVAVSPDGSSIYVSGYSYGKPDGSTGDADYGTLAYHAATGALQWFRRYNGNGNGSDTANSLAVSRAGTVFITGISLNAASSYGWATIAYGPAGTRLWVSRYDVGDARAYALGECQGYGVQGQADASPDYGAVDADVLQVAAE